MNKIFLASSFAFVSTIFGLIIFAAESNRVDIMEKVSAALIFTFICIACIGYGTYIIYELCKYFGGCGNEWGIAGN